MEIEVHGDGDQGVSDAVAVAAGRAEQAAEEARGQAEEAEQRAAGAEIAAEEARDQAEEAIEQAFDAQAAIAALRMDVMARIDELTATASAPAPEPVEQAFDDAPPEGAQPAPEPKAKPDPPKTTDDGRGAKRDSGGYGLPGWFRRK